MLLIEIRRRWLAETWTGGELLVDGRWIAFTLEDRVRDMGTKVPGKTAVWAGRYRVDQRWSRSFARPMPFFVGIPDFEGVEIHWGNDAEDTRGCPLVGLALDLQEGRILHSRDAFQALDQILTPAYGLGIQVEVEIQERAIAWDRRL